MRELVFNNGAGGAVEAGAEFRRSAGQRERVEVRDERVRRGRLREIASHARSIFFRPETPSAALRWWAKSAGE
jgi:hypothetical protein